MTTSGAVPGGRDGETHADQSLERSRLDGALAHSIDQANAVASAQDRLRVLLRAQRSIGGDLALPAVIRRIVEAASELARARFCALGVIGADGGLEQFVHSGMVEQTVARIGHLPEGKGLLGALIDDPVPIRLADIASDPRSTGFPDGHPAMSTFLGVPIRIRDEVYGNLYLAESLAGGFTEEDEDLVQALAASAAAAIDNARLYDEAERKQDWLQASAEVTRQLLSDTGDQPLEVIARRVMELALADVVTVVLPARDPGRLMVELACGQDAEALTAVSYPAEGTLSGEAIASRRAILIDDATEAGHGRVHLSDVVGVGPVMAIPLVGRGRALGALLVGRLHGRRVFTGADLQMATTFANHATVAVELADARADQQRVAMLEDRDRIARDLHDHVIQQLFAAGLTVQSVAAAAGPPVGARLEAVVDSLDDTIRQIRATIFQLRGSLAPTRTGLRHRLIDTAEDLTAALSFAPQLQIDGPVDTVVSDTVADDVVAVVRESLTNTARHAHANRVDVTITVGRAALTVDITDDGIGIGSTNRCSGLDNLRARAEQHGGTLTIIDHEGAKLRWTIPLT